MSRRNRLGCVFLFAVTACSGAPPNGASKSETETDGAVSVPSSSGTIAPPSASASPSSPDGVDSGAPSTSLPAATGCGLHTSYPGDDACLPAATDPAVIQLHYGPSSYDKPEAQFVLPAGGETTTCMVVMPSHGALLVRSYEVSERTGMHHFSLFTGAVNATAPTADLCSAASGFVFIAQQPHVAQTIGGGAPEYADAALQIPAGSFIVQAHALNTSTSSVLIEGWINLTTVPSTTQPVSSLGFAAGHTMHIAPGAKQTIHGAAAAIELPATVIQLVSHFHEHTSEGRAYFNGKEIYKNDSWSEPTTQWYTSLTGGPIVVQPAPMAGDAGGPTEGAFAITPTTSLSWECDVNNTTTGTLTFGNHAITQEMCCLQGLVLGVRPWVASVQ